MVLQVGGQRPRPDQFQDEQVDDGYDQTGRDPDYGRHQEPFLDVARVGRRQVLVDQPGVSLEQRVLEEFRAEDAFEQCDRGPFSPNANLAKVAGARRKESLFSEREVIMANSSHPDDRARPRQCGESAAPDRCSTVDKCDSGKNFLPSTC